jgi:hypothetical protein
MLQLIAILLAIILSLLVGTIAHKVYVYGHKHVQTPCDEKLKLEPHASTEVIIEPPTAIEQQPFEPSDEIQPSKKDVSPHA